MAEDEEYELLPRHEIENLKKELERLKKNPLGELKEGQTLLDAVTSLNNNIKRLIDIFVKADADMAKEYADNNPANTLTSIKEQNEQIAQGLVAVADMIKDIKESPQHRIEEPRLPPTQPYPPQGYGQSMPNMMNQMNQIPSPPSPPFELQNNMQNQFEPFPNNANNINSLKKKSLFSRR